MAEVHALAEKERVKMAEALVGSAANCRRLLVRLLSENSPATFQSSLSALLKGELKMSLADLTLGEIGRAHV